MTDKFKSHAWRLDYRKESLVQIITGLKAAITTLEDRVNEGSWYDGSFFLEDAEPIVGLAFIACQNYIYGSIKDRFITTETAKLARLTSPIIKQYNRTVIELIIVLANYCKHMDGDLTKATKGILNDFKFKFDGGIDSTPIFDGLELLSTKWDLEEVLLKVLTWREELWTIHEDLELRK
ncbi:MAG: hypothetical protein EOO43_00150 [Flavobacterium sp.]|nr:MAG: hypothetical protein EOO43_00150 [Flavobacterium sp.]